MPQTSNGWWSGGASQAWLIVASMTTVFPWWDFATALTTPHVALPDSLVTPKGPNNDGSFHTLEFTSRTLSRIHEAWPR